MKNRILALVLAILILCSVAACGPTTDPKDTTDAPGTSDPAQTTSSTETTEPAETTPVVKVPDTDKYQGADFTVLARYGNELIVNDLESAATVLDQAVYRRNKLVEEKYGIVYS